MQRSFLFICLLLLGGCRDERQEIRLVGSSTVFPFAASAAEHFGDLTDFRTPIVEENGTGGGIALFCQGIGSRSPADIANASRRIKDSERKDCAAHGVTDIVEIPLGYDGIVVAESRQNAPLDLTLSQLFLAIAKAVPRDGRLIPNPYKRWNEIDPSFPDRPIEVYGPPPSSGTRDTLVEFTSDVGCKYPEFTKTYPDEKNRKDACKLVRDDGRYIEGREDDNVIVLKLTANREAVGIFGYSYLEQNEGKVRAARIDGVAPTEATISEGRYKLARILYAYVKKQNIGTIPGLAEFAKSWVSEDAVGTEGYLTLSGLIPLPAQMKNRSQQAASSLARMEPASTDEK